MSGFVCDNCTCKKKQINISSNASVVIPKSVLLKSQLSDNFAYGANLIASETDINWRCEICSKVYPDVEINNLLQTAEKEYQLAVNAKESRQYLKAKDLFESLVSICLFKLILFSLDKHEFRIHPLHTLIVNSLTPLVNLSNFLKDYKCAIKSAKKLIACYDIVY